MSGKEPVIKFSPFEALFIGEKNKVLKRQPMKNTIFVTRLNNGSKTINLRDLFDLETNSKSKNNEVIFKMPQRVCDFLKSRKLKNKLKTLSNKKGDILCYEFEGHRVITKGDNRVVKSVKKVNSGIKQKVVKKYAINSCQKTNLKTKQTGKNVKKKDGKYISKTGIKSKVKRPLYKSKNGKFIHKKSKNEKKKVNKVLYRGANGKFIRKIEFLKLQNQQLSPKQKYLSNYLHQLYLKKNEKLMNHDRSEPNTSLEFKTPYSIETIIGLPNLPFDIKASEAILNEISKNFYENNCQEDFQFPKYPSLKSTDFDDDHYLTDLIYENFPKIARFESHNKAADFSDALLNVDILKPERNVKMYEHKRNGTVKDDVRQIISNKFPLIKLKRINHYDLIDEPKHRESHLIPAKNLGSFFFRSVEGKDIFIGNLVKPLLQNSWFGSLPES